MVSLASIFANNANRLRLYRIMNSVNVLLNDVSCLVCNKIFTICPSSRSYTKCLRLFDETEINRLGLKWV